MAPKVRVKICCISSAPEVAIAVKHGASAVGLVSAMPSGPGVTAESRIAELAGMVPPGMGSFLLTSKTNAEDIIDQQRYCRVNTLQLVDEMETRSLIRIRESLPGIGLVQVIHVMGDISLTQAKAVQPYVDALLLDSGNPNLAIKQLGGTGRVHDWEISREIVKSATKPVYLAGGLNPGNVAEAIRRVRPFGVDICGGLRREGKLEETLVKEFMAACE